MGDKIILSAVLVSVRMEKEGQWRVVFEVPASCRDEVVALSALTERLLRVAVSPQED